MPMRNLMTAAIAVFAMHITGKAVAQEGEPYLVKPIESGIQDIELVTSGGSLQVLHTPGEKTRLEIYIKGNNGNTLSKAEIEQRINEKYEFIIEAGTTKLKAVARNKGNWNDWKKALNISFKVYAPARVNANLKTSGGSIVLKGLTGNFDFATSGGSLTIDALKGNVNGRTSGGSIKVAGSEGQINLKTSGGSITASNCKGQVDLTTSGGSLKLDNLSGNIDAATSGGSIAGNAIQGDLNTQTSGGSVTLTKLRGNVEAATSGGSMTVEVLELGNYVKLRTSAGSINLSIPKNKGVALDLSGNKVGVDGLTNFSGTATDNEIKGALQGGGATVSARASSGRVNLTFN